MSRSKNQRRRRAHHTPNQRTRDVARAVAVPPTRAGLVWSSPLFDPSGYADEARQFLLGLDAIGVPVRANPIQWSNRLAELDPEDARRLNALQDMPLASDYIHVQHIFPTSFAPDSAAGASVGRTMFETDRIPDGWVERCNAMDQVWVPSEFNLATFAAAGVDPSRLRKLPGAIDARQFRVPRAPLPLGAQAHGFKFLSVFDWSLRKGWDVLLRAYVEEFAPDEDVCLVLKTYSSYGASDAELLERLRAAVADIVGPERRLPRISLLGGTLSNEELLRLYHAVDAYVMPSRGEGWGRPYMEAMATGLPTIGTNWSGNTEFMHADNAYLLDYDLVDVSAQAVAEVPYFASHRWAEPSLPHLRSLMREVFTHRDTARLKGARARAEILERFDQPVVARIAAEHLSNLLGRPAVRVPVAWEGSQFVYHSLAHVNREVCRELIASEQVELRVVPYERHQFDASADPRLRPVEQRILAPLRRPPAVHVRHQWPPNFTPPADGAWVMIQPWEFGGLPAEWVAPMRDQVDEIWVPSSWVRDCYIRSGVPGDKVAVIPNGVDLNLYRPDGPRYPLKTRKRFKFLFVGGPIMRKGIDVLLETYTETFTDQDDVCLVLKTLGSTSFYGGSGVEQALDRIRALPNSPAIEHISPDLTDAEVASLYRASDALVHPYRGEGFGMPIAEAMASGLPVIVTGDGAALDFCDVSNGYLIPARRVGFIEPNLPPPAAPGYWLAAPDPAALGQLMRRAVEEPEVGREMGRHGRARMRDYDWSCVSGMVLERLKTLAGRPPARLSRPLPFRPDLDPFPLNGTREVTFLHHPRWAENAWREVVCSYARAFGADDPVTLVLWLDPSQGLPESDAVELVMGALRESGLDPERTPDLLLVPDALDVHALASLYTAGDWVVPHGDAEQLQRAVNCGRQVLTRLDASTWRAAADAYPDRSLAA
jgi:glycosyltransferase involved in cell wall biosynthesis